MNKHLAKDLERYADMLAEGELISPDDLNCSAVMRLAAKALAQPEQEPVGEAYLCDLCHTPFDGAFQCPSCGHGRATKEPVYTTPPQRKPLTDEQLDDLLLFNMPIKDHRAFARAIEAAHGIKEKNT